MGVRECEENKAATERAWVLRKFFCLFLVGKNGNNMFIYCDRNDPFQFYKYY